MATYLTAESVPVFQKLISSSYRPIQSSCRPYNTSFRACGYRSHYWACCHSCQVFISALSPPITGFSTAWSTHARNSNAAGAGMNPSRWARRRTSVWYSPIHFCILLLRSIAEASATLNPRTLRLCPSLLALRCSCNETGLFLGSSPRLDWISACWSAGSARL